MRVGVTGHQQRRGLDWNWTSAALDEFFASQTDVTAALSSLSGGADQVFARSAIRNGVRLTAVIPIHDYEHFFSDSDLKSYKELLGQAKVIRLEGDADPQQAFFDAGRYIVDHTDTMIAVWDGQPAEGLGGTADVVAYAIEKGHPVYHLDAARKTQAWIDQSR